MANATPSILDRETEGFRGGHPPIQPGGDRPPVDARDLGPFRQRHRPAVVGDEAIAAGVPGLLGPVRPPAVVGEVAEGIVDPLDGMAGRRPRPHVREEGLERVSPAIAHRDAPAPISGVARVVGVEAALLDALPGDVFGRSGRVMDQARLPGAFGLVTPAARGHATTQVVGLDDDHPAALAAAEPAVIAPAILALGGHHHQAPEGLAGQVEEVTHLIEPSFPEFYQIDVLYERAYF